MKRTDREFEKNRLSTTTLAPSTLASHTVSSPDGSLCVVIIGYREDQKTLQHIQNMLHLLQTKMIDFEIIIVHTDKKQLKRDKLKIEPMFHKNCVKMIGRDFHVSFNAILQGIQKKMVCVVDAEAHLDHIAEMIPLLEKHDIVLGYRKQKRTSKRLRGTIWNSIIRFLLKISVHDINSGFSLYRADCLHSMYLETHGVMLYTEMLYKCIREGYTYTEVGIADLKLADNTTLVALVRGLWELFSCAQRWHIEELKATMK